MYRLAAIDLDGTLLTPDRKVSPRTVEVLTAWQAAGRHVVLATARPFYRIGRYLRLLGLDNADNFAIAFNGGLVMRADGAETVFNHTFTDKEIAGAIEYGTSIDAPIFVYLEGKILSNRDDALYREKNPDVDFVVVEDLGAVDWPALPVYKIAYVGTPPVVREMRAQLPPQLEQDYEVSSSVPQFVDLVPLHTSKARALDMVGRRLAVPAAEMIAFGDEDNDIPLLEFAGTGVAMDNASEPVKAVADAVCRSNADDGVARFLQDLLDQGR